MTRFILRSFFVPLVVLLMVPSAYAQERILGRPVKYDIPIKNMDTRPVGDDQRDMAMPWFVVAINENAVATSTPGGSGRNRPLSFGQYFFVVGESADYLKIGKDGSSGASLVLSPDADIYGWVHKDDVLMWNHALINPETNISFKGLIMNTSRITGESTIDYTRVQAYKDPAMNHPTGFEAAYILDTFSHYLNNPKRNSKDWIEKQINQHFDFQKNLMCKNTYDPNTLAARLYEVTRISDMDIEIETR